MASTPPRKRRTPEEARKLILNIAERRLRRLGLDGLNVVGVAEEAGLSHASVIHHFGSTAGMRSGLAERMTASLLQDLVAALQNNTEPKAILAGVFHAMAGGGHARLLAWRSLNEGDRDNNLEPEVGQLFGELIKSTAARFGNIDQAAVRNALLLIASAAIGMGVAGNALASLLEVDSMNNDNFAEWLANLLLDNHGSSASA